MDASVIAALAKWPNVPAVFGWLRLDRRGNWLIRDDRLHHPALIGFINRNYACDEQGRHFFQNGPQRVYAGLDYTPWVLRLLDGALAAQTGETVVADEALLDEEGNMLIAWSGKVGLIDDRDLAAMLGWLQHADGTPADDSAVLRAIDGGETNLSLELYGRRIPVASIRRKEVAARFGFDPTPLPN